VIGRNNICADSTVQCDQGSCLLINCNEEVLVGKLPELTTVSLKGSAHLVNPTNRNELLLGKLRLSHITEGLDEIKELCLDYHNY
jgi:hypothetical protein